MNHKVVSKEAWNEMRANILLKEKAMTRQRDALTAEIRAMPWVKVEKEYIFQTGQGPKTLAQLFEGKSQLVIQHLMLGSDKARPCPSCSFWADQLSGAHCHLPQRDVSTKVVSRAPLATLQEWKEKLGWTFDWVSSQGSDFNYDFNVTTPEHAERPGFSIFFHDRGSVYHTYFTTGRGLEIFNPTYSFLDLVPKGRDEDGLQYPMAWVKRHNEYTE